MIEPGHPFAKAYTTVIEALEERLRYGTEQPDRFRFVFQPAVAAYVLPREASAVASVAGPLGATYTVFEQDRDYEFAENRVVWLAHPDSRHPDAGARFDVDYTYRERRSGLTDFNEGSV
ncbi:MAG: hypothetical protein LC720_04365, partial [Actinobacteria bacterium]|nr:hypothetical protein [Actinomycetota bacterium]